MTKLTRAAVEARLEPYAALGSEREIAYALIRAWDALEEFTHTMRLHAMGTKSLAKARAALPAQDEK